MVLRSEVVGAVGLLMQSDPARVLAVASSLRGLGRLVESTIEGRSMGRTLRPGTRIRIALEHREWYGRGAIVAFVVGEKVVVHRVVHRGSFGPARAMLVTRGDAPWAPDPPIRRSQVLGAVSAVLEGDRWEPPAGAPRRSLRARFAAALLLTPVVALLYVSPRGAGALAAILHRMEWLLRAARVRGPEARGPASRRPDPS